MELTQERLDQLRFVKADNGSTLALTRDEVINVIQEITGEKVTIVEPEPEIPREAIEAVSEVLDGFKFATPEGFGYAANAVLQAAYKAGWGGLRK